ncbi:hypothetical protein CAE01nite_07200 [Cellulomonas aerilata]|uniref:Uncharacterized protein n=1 Tax=Cellulomonas aerilata TaxID=515326 RepID=A0A512D9A7_9CELL|nr:hypothetical protein CAE01nite_07200 [Cellulomonas aerilata]
MAVPDGVTAVAPVVEPGTAVEPPSGVRSEVSCDMVDPVIVGWVGADGAGDGACRRVHGRSRCRVPAWQAMRRRPNAVAVGGRPPAVRSLDVE